MMACLGEGERGGEASHAATDNEDVQFERRDATAVKRNGLGWG